MNCFASKSQNWAAGFFSIELCIFEDKPCWGHLLSDKQTRPMLGQLASPNHQVLHCIQAKKEKQCLSMFGV
jgi:hypothetical protein